VDVAEFWSRYGQLVHGHQIVGLDHVPDEGAAVIVYYHGAIPIDYAFLLSRILLQKKRIVRSDSKISPKEFFVQAYQLLVKTSRK
jgi:hypothetical protein